MPEPESNAEILRNRLSAFAPVTNNLSCAKCGRTLVAGSDACTVCGAPVERFRTGADNVRVATAAPELSAKQKPYDPYAIPAASYAVPRDPDPADEPAAPEDAADTEPPEPSQPEEQSWPIRKYVRAALGSVLAALLVIGGVYGWKSRNRARSVFSQVNQKLSFELAALKGGQGSRKPEHAVSSRNSAPEKARSARQHTPTSKTALAMQRSPAVQLLNVHANPRPLGLASESGDLAPGPLLANAAASPMRVAISPRDSLALLLHSVSPIYPAEARQRRVQGSVALKAVIGRDGTVQSLQTVSGDALLTPAAIAAVRQWRYRPYFAYGEPREVETTILVEFSLAKEN